MTKMTTIWKFQLELTSKQTIEMPMNAEILTLQTQLGVPCIWVGVDPDAPKQQRYFEIYGTGHPIESSKHDRHYIGSYQTEGGRFVFHVFEIIIPTAGVS